MVVTKNFLIFALHPMPRKGGYGMSWDVRNIGEPSQPHPARGRKCKPTMYRHHHLPLQLTPRKGTETSNNGLPPHPQRNNPRQGTKQGAYPTQWDSALFDLHVIYFTAGSSWLSFSSAAEPSASEVFSDNSVCKFSSSVFKRTFVNVALA